MMVVLIFLGFVGMGFGGFFEGFYCMEIWFSFSFYVLGIMGDEKLFCFIRELVF